MSLKSVVFDLDGTLVHSLPDVTAALNAVMSGRSLDISEVRNMVGHGAKPMIEMALKAKGEIPQKTQTDDLLDDFIAYYKSHPVDHSSLFPGVIEGLEGLLDRGIDMGICTNKPSSTTALVLEAYDLNRFFKAVTCGDTLNYKKPDGRHILKTLEDMGLTRVGAVMVGDSESDIEAAKDLGIPSVAVTFGYSIKPSSELGADEVITGFDQLIPVLEYRIRYK